MTESPEHFFILKSPLQRIITRQTEDSGIELFIKRDDLLHPGISGNKWRKLKYNLIELKASGKEGIVTLGGAFSNHLHAVAVAGKVFGISTIGIVRGEKPAQLSKTLLACLESGMKLHFVSRGSYKEKGGSEEVQALISKYPSFLFIPEGGENEAAKKGCAEIINELDFTPDYVCVPCGTGTTLAGLVQSNQQKTKFLGFPVLKGAENTIIENIETSSRVNVYQLISDYHFGGYAKHTTELLDFIRSFEKETGIILEQVYTGKMLFGIMDLISKGFFPKRSKIVTIHTGGLQGRLPELNS